MRLIRKTTPYAFLMALSGLLFILLAVLVKAGLLKAFDEDVLAFFSTQVTPVHTLVFQFLTWAGSIFLLAPVCALLVYALYRQHREFDALLLLISFSLAAVIARLLKFIIGRERPELYPALADTFTDLAFPSVHATQITVFCLAVLPLLRTLRPLTTLVIALLLFTLAIAVMYSRLYLQLHYPSDIIGGALLAIVSVTATVLLVVNLRGH